MPGNMMSAASSRLFRRHTYTDISYRRVSRKRFTRRGRLASTRSISRLSTFSSRKSDLFPDVVDSPDSRDAAVSDATSTSCASTTEESVFSEDQGEDTIISSTVIDINERVEEVDRQVRDDVDEEDETCENIFSKLLDLIQCFPHNQQLEKPHETDDDAFDMNDVKIECILQQTIAEESDELDATVSPLNETAQHMTSRDMVLPPPEWIQEPLLLVATPGSGMLIRRIRRVSDPSYFESPASLPEVVQESDSLDNSKVIQLPINNGREQPAHSWVIDFETPVFAGTALFRIRGSNDWKSPTDDSGNSKKYDYFANQNRKFQMVIRGTFKTNVIMADCTSGLLLDHPLSTSRTPGMNCVENCIDDQPCSSDSQSNGSAGSSTKNKSKRLRRPPSRSSKNGSLPPKWALRAAVKVARLLSPRMDADLEGAHPRILSPLCSTAQTISVCRNSGGDNISTQLDETHAEPCPDSDASLIKDLDKSLTKKAGSTTNHSQQRKRAFNAAYDARVESLAKSSLPINDSPYFDTESEYTFEFLQHLVDYNDLSLDLGKILGKVSLGGALRGQPVRLLSAVVKQSTKNEIGPGVNMKDLDCLWSFDLW
ncbi:hypothetical protein ACHAXR_002166, partial [Thalassiosira sp. AJA248-18]